MSMSLVRTALLGLLVLAPASLGQTVAGVTPDEGTIQTQFTINGTDLGIKKGKVYLTKDGVNKKFKCAVTSWTDTGIVATIRKIKTSAGVFVLNVMPKGTPPIQTGFTVLPPTVTVPMGAETSPNEQFSLTVDDAGKKLKVVIGNQKAKIMSIVPSETEAQASTVTILVPKKLTNGAFNVNVSNPVGAGTQQTALTIVGSSAQKIGKPLFTFAGPCTFNHKPISVQSTSTGLQVVGGQTAFGGNAYTCTVELDMQIPGSVPATSNGLTTGVIYNDFFFGGTWSSSNEGGSVSLTVQALTETQMSGIFTATVVGGEPSKPLFPLPPVLQVTGSFIVDLPEGD